MFTFTLPDLGEGLHSARIQTWHVNVGDTVNIDMPLVTVETAKSCIEIPAPHTGDVVSIHKKIGETVPVGETLVTLRLNSPAQQIMPAARLYAKKHQLDIQALIPNKQTVTLQDIESAHKDAAKPIMSMSQVIEHAYNAVALTTIHDYVDVSAWFGTQDTTARIIQSIITSIHKTPKVNAHFDSKTQIVSPIADIHLGLAVQTKDNLLLPVITHMQQKTDINTIRAHITALKSDPSQYTQEKPTCLFSNIGTYAGFYSTPLVIPPCVLIIAVGKIRSMVIPKDNTPCIASVLPVSISFDHRALTGADAATFLAHFLHDSEKSSSALNHPTSYQSQHEPDEILQGQ